MKFNNQTIYYETYGEGFPLVFLHGFCEDSRLWQMFVEPFKNSYQVVLIDLMGFGKSDTPKEATINYLAKAIKAVLERLNIEKSLIIGHSLGGYVALAFAELFPESLSGICLFHSHPFADSAVKKRNRQKGIDFINKNGVRPFVKQLIPTLFNDDFRKTNLAIIHEMIDNAALYDKKGIIYALEAMKNRPTYEAVLASLDFPVLLIIGKKDEAILYEDSLKMCHLPQFADVQILEEIGHVGMLEGKEETQKILQNFVDLIMNDLDS